MKISPLISLAVVLALPSVGAGSPGSVRQAPVRAALPPALRIAERGIDAGLTAPFRKRFRWAPRRPWKESSDNCFLPIFLLRELGSEHPGLLCRTLGYDYSGLHAATMRGPPGAAKTLSSLLSNLRLSAHRIVRFDLLTANFFPIGLEYPVLLRWKGVVGQHGGAARISWYEPVLSFESLGYSDAPGNSGYAWDGRRSVDESHPGAGYSPPFYSNYRPGGPVLTFPFGTYSAALSLDLWPVVTRPTRITPAASRTDLGGLTLRGPVNWDSGPSRWERFQVDGNSIRSIEIWQPKVGLMQYLTAAPAPVTYSYGGIQRHTTFWPTTRISYLAHGRRVAIEFGARPPGGGSDKPQDAATNRTYPRKIVITRGGQKRFVAWYLKLRYLTGSVPASPWPRPIGEAAGYLGESKGIRVRVRFARDVRREVAQHDWTALSASLRAYRRVLLHERVPIVFFVYDAEILADQTAATYSRKGRRASVVASRFLLPAYQLLRPDQIAKCAAQCVEQYHYGLAIVATEALEADTVATPQLRRWAAVQSAMLKSLVARIRSRPTLYRRYAATNRLFRWGRLTKQNEVLAGAGTSRPANLKGDLQ